MKKYPILLVSAFATIQLSCSGRQTENKAEDNCGQDVTTEAKADTVTVAGQLAIGHEVRSFKADNDTLEYWFVDKTGKVKEMYEEIAPEGMKNCTPVNAELKVIYKGKSDDGFAADYDGVVEIVEVMNIEKQQQAGL